MNDLTQGNIYKKFILFAVPIVLSGLLSQAYQIIDTAIAGQFLGDVGLAQIGATTHVISVISSLSWGFSTGFSIYVARLFGGHDYKRLKEDVINAVAFVALVMGGIGIISAVFSDLLLDLVRVADEIRQGAKQYFCIYSVGLFAIVLNNTFSKILNALGISGFPFYMSIVSGLINVAGNILSVTVFDFGVMGIAAASVLAALVVDFLYLLKLFACFRKMGIAEQKHSFNLHAVRACIKYALPSMLQQSSMYIASFAMSPIVNAIGAQATAGYTVANRIFDINAGVYQNSSVTLSNHTAQCVGAGKFGRIRKGLFVAAIQGFAFVTPFILVCVLFARPVNAAFFPQGFSGAALDYAVLFSAVYLPFTLFNVINNLFHSFFRGVGAMRLLLISTVLGSGVRILAGAVLGGIMGMNGIYLGWVISWVAEALFMIVVYLIKYNTEEKIRKGVE